MGYVQKFTDTPLPTPEEIGALPVEGTAADSAKLGGQESSYYMPAKFTNTNEKDVLTLPPGSHVVDGVILNSVNLGLCFVEVKQWAVGNSWRIVTVYPMGNSHQIWMARLVENQWQGWEIFQGTV